jgi:hypothetical protein
MKQQLAKNKLLFRLGFVHLIIFVLLWLYSPFHHVEILGINAMIKPMKFALSIWIYSWTMSLILSYLTAARAVKIYSWVAVVAMSFEQIAITSQAFRGELSHFNQSSAYGIVVFALMGVFILTITLWTAYMAYLFIKQKKYPISSAKVTGIRFGLVYFVVFSLFGGYVSGLQGHTVGAADGSNGIWLLNWSTLFGDLRVAHFFGIHSLQMIPLFAMMTDRYFSRPSSKRAVQVFALLYLGFVLFTMIQGLRGLPFVS